MFEKYIDIATGRSNMARIDEQHITRAELLEDSPINVLNLLTQKHVPCQTVECGARLRVDRYELTVNFTITELAGHEACKMSGTNLTDATRSFPTDGNVGVKSIEPGKPALFPMRLWR